MLMRHALQTRCKITLEVRIFDGKQRSIVTFY